MLSSEAEEMLQNKTKKSHTEPTTIKSFSNEFGLANFLKNIQYSKSTARRAFSYWLVGK